MPLSLRQQPAVLVWAPSRCVCVSPCCRPACAAGAARAGGTNLQREAGGLVGPSRFLRPHLGCARRAVPWPQPPATRCCSCHHISACQCCPSCVCLPCVPQTRDSMRWPASDSMSWMEAGPPPLLVKIAPDLTEADMAGGWGVWAVSKFRMMRNAWRVGNGAEALPDATVAAFGGCSIPLVPRPARADPPTRITPSPLLSCLPSCPRRHSGGGAAAGRGRPDSQQHHHHAAGAHWGARHRQGGAPVVLKVVCRGRRLAASSRRQQMPSCQPHCPPPTRADLPPACLTPSPPSPWPWPLLLNRRVA